MGIQTAAVLYPVNTTTVDTGTGIDVRLLDSAQAGADDDTQTCTATHTQDNQVRAWDPANASSANRDPTNTLLKQGWATRLTEDMTPADDTNCNACLTAGTLTVNLQVAVNQAGGTYTGGTYTPAFVAGLWRYNPSTDTGTLIANGFVFGPSWNYTPVTGDLGTFKAAAVPVAVTSLTEFQAGEVLLVQLGVAVVTIPNPSVGTATWTYTLRVDNVDTNITFAAGQGIRTLCPVDGTVAGSAEALGVSVKVLPTVGIDSSIATVLGVLQADANMVGISSGSATVSGVLQSIAQMAGISGGVATASGVLGAILGTVGTCNIGEVSDPEPEPEPVEVSGGGGGVRFIPVEEINRKKSKKKLEEFLNRVFTDKEFSRILNSLVNKFSVNQKMIDPMLTEDEEALLYIILMLD